MRNLLVYVVQANTDLSLAIKYNKKKGGTGKLTSDDATKLNDHVVDLLMELLVKAKEMKARIG